MCEFVHISSGDILGIGAIGYGKRTLRFSGKAVHTLNHGANSPALSKCLSVFSLFLVLRTEPRALGMLGEHSV